MVKAVEILITERFFTKEDTIEQHFSFNKRDKNLRFIREHYYLLYDRFEKKIRDSIITVPGIIEFIERIDYDDRIVMIYKVLDKDFKTDFVKKNKHIRMMDYVPPYRGCSYCVFREEETDVFFRCKKRDKSMTDDMKRCKFFKQKLLF